MFGIVIPGRMLTSVKWTGRSVGINQRNAIGRKKIKSGRVVPIIIKSEKYKQFCESLAIVFRSQYQESPIMSQVFMVCYAGMHKWGSTKKDIDAFHKATQDAIHLAGIIGDDSQVVGYIMVPLPEMPSQDFIQVDLFDLKDIAEMQIVSAKEER